jgi:hypothetical protein
MIRGNGNQFRMRGMALLVRLAQHRLEQRRADLNLVMLAKSQTEADIGTLEATRSSESGIAHGDQSVLGEYGAWARQAAHRRGRLGQRVAELESTAGVAREQVRESAIEARRFELALDAMSSTTKRVAQKKAEARADERELARRAPAAD